MSFDSSASGCSFWLSRQFGETGAVAVEQVRDLVRPGRYAARNARFRSRSKFARLYVCRLTSLSLVTWPSVCPLLQASDMAASTACLSRLNPSANDRSTGGVSPAPSSQTVPPAVAQHTGKLLRQPVRGRRVGASLLRALQIPPLRVGQLLLSH